jgi:hypothetical protein
MKSVSIKFMLHFCVDLFSQVTARKVSQGISREAPELSTEELMVDLEDKNFR